MTICYCRPFVIYSSKWNNSKSWIFSFAKISLFLTPSPRHFHRHNVTSLLDHPLRHIQTPSYGCIMSLKEILTRVRKNIMEYLQTIEVCNNKILFINAAYYIDEHTLKILSGLGDKLLSACFCWQRSWTVVFFAELHEKITSSCVKPNWNKISVAISIFLRVQRMKSKLKIIEILEWNIIYGNFSFPIDLLFTMVPLPSPGSAGNKTRREQHNFSLLAFYYSPSLPLALWWGPPWLGPCSLLNLIK